MKHRQSTQVIFSHWCSTDTKSWVPEEPRKTSDMHRNRLVMLEVALKSHEHLDAIQSQHKKLSQWVCWQSKLQRTHLPPICQPQVNMLKLSWWMIKTGWSWLSVLLSLSRSVLFLLFIFIYCFFLLRKSEKAVTALNMLFLIKIYLNLFELWMCHGIVLIFDRPWLINSHIIR